MYDKMTFSVIVVDDEKLILKNIVRNIEETDSSFKVVATARNGAEALELIKEYTPHIVFTDIRMPVMDGLELTFQINQQFPSIKKVIVSGYDDFSYAKCALKNNIRDYLLKPINNDELKTLLLSLRQSLIAELNNPSLLPDSSHQTSKEIVTLVQQFFHANYRSQIDLNTLSAQFGFSSSYLTKIFVKHANISPLKYLTEYRMTIAKQLFSNPNLSIKATAELCGYSDPFHFSKLFKKITGESPASYRATHKNTLENISGYEEHPDV
jgi:YesN/AraC family two-component response regulator